MVTVLKRSLLTGKVVWFYQGPSEGAARLAYWRAKKKELERVKNWSKTASKKAENISRMLSECLANIKTPLTQKQTEAVRRLRAIIAKGLPCDLDFYNHIIEEQRIANEDREIRMKMRERREKEKQLQE